MKYKVLLNATTLPTGGVVQSCVSFINISLNQPSDIEWIYIVSKKVKYELDMFDTKIDEKSIIVFEESPAKNIQLRKKLFDLSEKILPDAVFTFFGPAYVKFNYPHLCGVADGWVTHSTWLAYKTLPSSFEKLTRLLRCIYSGYWFRFADMWVVEAECAKNGMAKRLYVQKKNIHVVMNTCAKHYIEKKPRDYKIQTNKRIKILTLSSYYPHKNFEIIPSIAKELKLLGHKDFEFIVTFERESKEELSILSKCKKNDVSECFNNIGPVSLVDGPELYDVIDIVLQSSLLESFSANYPEAMSMNKPLVVTDLGFARDICFDAALYYKPTDAKQAALAISKLINDKQLVADMINRGKKVLSELPDSHEKYHAYEKLVKKLIVDYKK